MFLSEKGFPDSRVVTTILLLHRAHSILRVAIQEHAYFTTSLVMMLPHGHLQFAVVGQWHILTRHKISIKSIHLHDSIVMAFTMR